MQFDTSEIYGQFENMAILENVANVNIPTILRLNLFTWIVVRGAHHGGLKLQGYGPQGVIQVALLVGVQDQPLCGLTYLTGVPPQHLEQDTQRTPGAQIPETYLQPPAACSVP